MPHTINNNIYQKIMQESKVSTKDFLDLVHSYLNPTMRPVTQKSGFY